MACDMPAQRLPSARVAGWCTVQCQSMFPETQGRAWYEGRSAAANPSHHLLPQGAQHPQTQALRGKLTYGYASREGGQMVQCVTDLLADGILYVDAVLVQALHEVPAGGMQIKV